MPDIFQSTPGTVAVMSQDTALPGSIVIAQPQFPTAGTALISAIRYNQRTNQQFQTSLDAVVYIYVFGDLMGDVEVEGIAFPGMCDGGSSGLFDVMDYYNNNRASKTPKPIYVLAGGQKVTGFLTGLRIAGNNSTGDDPFGLLNRYSLIINALPSK